MQLVRRGQEWVIEGPGKERACIAYAHTDRGRLTYSIGDAQSERVPAASSVVAARVTATRNASASS